MRKPSVTVLLPVYNAERFLRKAIDSILVQTYSDYEFIIVDDGSTDTSGDIVESYQDPRLRRFYSKKNERLVGALNKGLRHARGRYIAVMNADDISHPRRIEKQVSYMNSHPEIGVAGSYAVYIDEDDATIGRICPPPKPDILSWHMFYYCPLINPTTMIRYDVLKEIGYYDRAFEYAEDYNLWSRIVGVSKIANIPEFLLKYRLWGGCISATRVDQMRQKNIQIKHFLVTRELGHSIAIETAGNLLKIDLGSTFSSVDEIEDLFNLNYELYKKFVKSRSLGWRERWQIETNISRKLYLLSFKAIRINIAGGFAMFLRVFRLFPLMFLRLFSITAVIRQITTRKLKLVGAGSLWFRSKDDW